MKGARGVALSVVAAMMIAGASLRAEAAQSCPPGMAELSDGACGAEEIARLDSDVTRAFDTAFQRIDETGRRALKADQGIYDSVRAAGIAATDFHLATQMEMRRDFLLAIREPHGKWLGDWANATGSMRIARRAGGGFSVRASAAEPALGVWQCEFDDTALMINGAISVGHGSAELEHGGPNEGWTLTLRLTGDVMSVEETAPTGKDGKPPFCTGDGRLAGAYFSQAAHRADERQAGR